MSQAPDSLHDPVETTPELDRKNVRFGLGLFTLFLALFGGTFGVGCAYLWLS